MKILITGACGYLGSELLNQLDSLSSSCLIRIFDNFSSGSPQALLNLSNKHRFELVTGDILNPSILPVILNGIDIVIHLAAKVLTPMSYSDQHSAEQVNHWGTLNLLKAALDANVDHFIFISTSAIYGPVMEGKSNITPHPVGHYAHSKYNAEKSIEAYINQGLNISTLRLGSLYGLAPITRFDSVVNKFIHLAGTRKVITVYGTGEQRRPCIHVKDCAKSILFALENKRITSGKFLNLVEANYSINELSQFILDHDEDISIKYIDQDVRNHYSIEVEDNYKATTNQIYQHDLQSEIGRWLKLYKGFQKIRFG